MEVSTYPVIHLPIGDHQFLVTLDIYTEERRHRDIIVIVVIY